MDLHILFYYQFSTNLLHQFFIFFLFKLYAPEMIVLVSLEDQTNYLNSC
jgi:hypothetical protein